MGDLEPPPADTASSFEFFFTDADIAQRATKAPVDSMDSCKAAKEKF
jgi:hypothetical protein